MIPSNVKEKDMNDHFIKKHKNSINPLIVKCAYVNVNVPRRKSVIFVYFGHFPKSIINFKRNFLTKFFIITIMIFFYGVIWTPFQNFIFSPSSRPITNFEISKWGRIWFQIHRQTPNFYYVRKMWPFCLLGAIFDL